MEAVSILKLVKGKSARKKVRDRKLTMGYHNGRLQVLPVYSEFPSMTMKQLIENWFVGNQKENITSFVLLDDEHVRHLGTSKTKNSGRNKLRQMKAVMKVVKRYAIDENCWTEDKQKWNIEYTQQLWDKVGKKYIYMNYMDHLKKGKKRHDGRLSRIRCQRKMHLLMQLINE
jgi:hypothetical protein